MAGQPTKYKEEYCEKIVEFMSVGGSLTQFAASIDVCRETVYEWGRVHPKFSDAIKMAKTKCEAHWEKIGHEGMYMGGKENPFQASMYIFKMKARFGWRDNQDINLKSDTKIQLSYNLEDDDDE